MKYAIMFIMMVFLATTVFASESNITLANRAVAINALMADNAIISAGATTLTNTTGSATVKVTAIMQTITPLIMAWLDNRFTYDKVVKKIAPEPDNSVTYWHKVSQLRLQTEMTQIDVSGLASLIAEWEAIKAKANQEYNAKINAFTSQSQAIATAPVDTDGE